MTYKLEDETPQEMLEHYRLSIDNMDDALIHVIAERFRITKQVGKLKAKNDLPSTDKEREKRQIERLRMLAKQAGLDPDFAEKLLNFIIEEVIKHHEEARR